jgi:hypothetical protein
VQPTETNMTDDKETETEETAAPEESGKTFEEFVKGLSSAQLAAVKATVQTVAAEREGLNLSRMSDNEARAAIEKKYGFNPHF